MLDQLVTMLGDLTIVGSMLEWFENVQNFWMGVIDLLLFTSVLDDVWSNVVSLTLDRLASGANICWS